MNISSKTISK